MTLTLTVAGVVPAVGVTDSHEPPDEVVAEALKLTAVFVGIPKGEAANTEIACAAGFEPPIWKLNGCSEGGLTESAEVPGTL